MEATKQRKRTSIGTEHIADVKDTAIEEVTETADTESSSYAQGRKKPYMRGRVHRYAFYMTAVLYIVILYTTNIHKVYLSVYFASQAVMYGVSSTYHLTEWKNKKYEQIFRKLDHSSIFLLISGTQVCVFMAIKELCIAETFSLVFPCIFTYTIGIIGILKVCMVPGIPRYINVVYYIIHGVSAVAVVPVKALVREYVAVLLCLLGGVSYIIGGVIYGRRKPDPWPRIFGYHEVFHVLTVLGNLCFLLTVIWAVYKHEVCYCSTNTCQ